MNFVSSLLAGLLLCAAPAQAQEPVSHSATASVDAQPDPDASRYTLGPGDAIEVGVYEEPDMSGLVMIEPGGKGHFPFLGAVAVEGLTVSEVAAKLVDILGDSYLRDPRVTVRVEKFGSKKVKLYGAVQHSEVYLRADVGSLDEVLAQAGVSARDAHEVWVRRGDEQVAVNLETLLVHGEGNLDLRSGDVIHVPEGMVVYINGEVAQPSAVPYRRGLTVIQALTSAGGLTDIARLRGAYILRDADRIPINLRRILDGRADDVALQRGDQVVVPEGIF